MGYFTFLQEEPTTAPEVPKKKPLKKPGSEMTELATQESAPPATSQASPEAALSKIRQLNEELEPLEHRANSLRRDVLERLQTMRDNPSGLEQVGLAGTGNIEALKRVLESNEDEQSLANDLDELEKRYRATAYGQVRADQLRRMANDMRMAASMREDVAAIRSKMPSRPGLEGLQQAELANLEARSEEIKKTVEALPPGTGVLGKEKLLAEQRQVASALAEKQKTWLPRPPEPTAPPSLDELYEGSRLKPDDVMSAMLELRDKYKLDLNARANFKTGLRQLLKDEFPDLIPEFAAYESSLRDRGAAPEKPTALGKPTELARELGRPAIAEAERIREKELVRELGDAQELQSWHSIIAFILLSYVIGPRMAMLFFSNAKKKGTLGAELNTVRTRIANAESEEKERQRRAFDVRRMAAAQHMTGMREEARAARSALYRLEEKMLSAWALAMEGATSPNEKNYIDGMRRTFSRTMQLGQLAQNMMKTELAEKYFADAEAIADELSRLSIPGQNK